MTRYTLHVHAAPGVAVQHAEADFATPHMTADDAITYAQRLVTIAGATPLEYLAVCNLESGETIAAAGCTFRLEDHRPTYSAGAGEQLGLLEVAPTFLERAPRRATFAGEIGLF